MLTGMRLPDMAASPWEYTRFPLNRSACAVPARPADRDSYPHHGASPAWDMYDTNRYG